jgi:hypothetical protein
MIREKQLSAPSGWVVLAILLTVLVLLVLAIFREAAHGAETVAWHLVALGLAAAVDGLCLGGLFVVNPNEAQVLQLFGKYMGTA